MKLNTINIRSLCVSYRRVRNMGSVSSFPQKKYAFSGFPQIFFSSFRDSEMAFSDFRPHFLYFFRFSWTFLVLFRLSAKSIAGPPIGKVPTVVQFDKMGFGHSFCLGKYHFHNRMKINFEKLKLCLNTLGSFTSVYCLGFLFSILVFILTFNRDDLLNYIIIRAVVVFLCEKK